MKLAFPLFSRDIGRFLYPALVALVAAGAAPAEVGWQSDGVAVCAVAGPQESPYVVSLSSGGAVVVWADARQYDYDIYAQKLDSAGHQVWAAGGVLICGVEFDQQFPAAVEDGAGGVIVVWQDGRLGDDGLALYAQRVMPDGSVAWQAGGVPVCSYASGLTDPPMAFSHVVTGDGAGGVIAAWRDTRADPVNGNTEIYAQRVNGSGTAMWTANGVKILGFAGQKWSTRNPIVASDGAGGAVIAWQDARSFATAANDLYAQRISSAGTPMWANNGVVVCNASGEQGYPDIVGLPGGASAIAWEDKRSGNYDIYVQELDASGSPRWDANGRLICSSPNDQRTPRVCSDGSDGLIIAWTDKRGSTTYTDIYAQRLDSSGAPLWADQGAAICTAAGSQTRIRMSPSTDGFTILTWMDTRNETLSAVYDLYGQMIDSTATPRWAGEGIPVAAITGRNQRMQQVSGDGAGSICAVWEDDRNAGDWDIFSQKLTPWLPVVSIPDAKARPSGTLVSMPARVVTGSFSGCFYIEEMDRSAGIRVEYPEPLARGSIVAVSGMLEFGPEPFVSATVVEVSGTSPVPGALGVTASRLGGESIGQVAGLTNIGLLVRTWGTVLLKPTAEQPYMVITDGVRDLRVYGSADVEVGDVVTVTGVCSGESTLSGTIPTILTRDSTDVRKIRP